MGDPHRRLPEVAAALSDAPIAHTDSREEAIKILADLFARVPDFPTAEARLERFGFLVAEVRSVQQLASTTWARERQVFTEVEPGTRVAAAPFRSDRCAIGVRGPAPRLGEHTREILANRLSMTAETLDELERQGVIRG
jgi:crotonobetainyl-CoA:carnitine CoA-transferase CaiB-like acyl-CoA transferase